MRGLSNPPSSPVAASLLSPEKPPPTAGTIVEVRMLKDAKGQTSHTGRPYILEAKKGECHPVSGDLAKLWLESGTCALSGESLPSADPPSVEVDPAAKPDAKPRKRKRRKR